MMPAYLVHGFRWPRSAIRCHVIYNNIDDAAPEYIVSPKTSTALIDSFNVLYPDTMDSLPELHFVEQYDPSDTSEKATSQPFAFVADRVEECKLSINVNSAIRQGGSVKETRSALVDLKERLAPNEQLDWYVVHNGDEMRSDASTRELVGSSYYRRARTDL